METFSALLALCAGNSPVPGEFPAQILVRRSFDVFFDLRPNKRLSKQSWGWWFETLSYSLWRHRNGFMQIWLNAVWFLGELPDDIYVDLHPLDATICSRGTVQSYRNDIQWWGNQICKLIITNLHNWLNDSCHYDELKPSKVGTGLRSILITWNYFLCG